MLTASEKKVKLDEVVRRRLDDKILNKGESPEALFADLLMTSDYEKFFNGGTTYGYLDDDYNIEEPFVVTKTRSIEHEETILSNQYDRYFGEKSRINFHKRYKQQRKDMNRRSNKDITDMPSKLLSPRSMYLREVDKNNLLPLSLLLRKENKPLGLYLGHRGLGDDRLLPVVQVLEKLPALQTIDLSDNRLTDKTLTMFAVKLQELHSLTYLDLSYNKIDESSSVIMDYIIHPRCKLNALILNGADVDDNECGNLAKAISLNKTIQILGLAHNLIGKSEILNVLHPDLITGGEAIGEMLKVNTTLTKLDLSWNAVRLESAIALAESLEVNTTLKTLLLAYNSFGDIPSQVLGRTLKVNKGLTELDIESNSITPKAATVLANSISFNEALLKLNINGNVLGRIGAQALVAAIQRSSTDTRKLQVSFINCDCRMEDDNIFSAACPYGKWKLNLAEPYGQMVAVECLYLANHRAGCKIDRLYYNGELVTLERSFGENDKDSEAKKFKFKEFLNNCNEAAENLINGNIDEASRLLQILLDQFGFTMAPDNREIVLKKTLELWNAKAKRERREDLQEVFLYEIFFALFVLNDTDMSGTMELEEFLETLESLGKPKFPKETAKRLMAEQDREGSGSIDANEFGMIMLNEFCKTELPKGDLVDSATGKPWEIPATGQCIIQLSCNTELPSLFDIGQDYGIDNIIKSIREAKTDDQREILFQNTTSSPYFFLSFEQSQMLLEVMQSINRMPLDIMANILPQIVNCDQANKFIDLNLNDIGKLALRVRIGPLYNAYVGLYSGHYAIDMKVAEQKNGAKRLGAICIAEGKYCREVGVNTSQKGNNSNFRNEKLGFTNMDLTGRWFSSAAAVGCTKVLHADYVSTTKPKKGQPPMSDAKFEALIERLNLDEIRVVWERLCARAKQWQNQVDSMTSSIEGILSVESSDSTTSQKSYKTVSKRRSITFNPSSFDSYPVTGDVSKPSTMPGNHNRPSTGDTNISGVDSKPSTANYSRKGKSMFESEYGEFGSAKEADKMLNNMPPMPFPINPYEFKELLIDSPFSIVQLKEANSEYIDTCHNYWDIYPEERMRDISRVTYNANERPVTPEEMKGGYVPAKGVMHPIFVLVYKKILLLEIQMPNVYFSVDQLIQLLGYFPPNEGYYRIMLIQSVFSHIVDLENMHLIIDDVLTHGEQLEIFHRIGIMNLLDPMKPDRLYRLDLRRFDHREFVKILVSLAVAEPGDNWEGEEYRWGKYDNPVPGWTLPATWTYFDDGGNTGGPRIHGWLRLKYRSYGNGCNPVMSVRRQLRKRTLAGMKVII